MESATLRFFLDGISGVPAGPVSVWHSNGDNDVDLVVSDYEDVTYVDTLRDLVNPSDVGQAYYDVDVTEFVRSDYAVDQGNPQSAFRLQVDQLSFVDDDQGGRYRFIMPGAGANSPELVLAFIPEPSTLLLCLIALGVVGGWRRWSECRRVVDVQADDHPPSGGVFRLRKHTFFAKRVQLLQVLTQPLGVFRLHRIPAGDALAGAPDGTLARDVEEGWETAQRDLEADLTPPRGHWIGSAADTSFSVSSQLRGHFM